PIAVEVTRIELIPIAQAPCPRPTLAPSGDPVHGEGGPGRNPQLCLAIGHTTTQAEQVGLPIAVEVTRIELIPIAQAPCPRPTLAPSGDPVHGEGGPGRNPQLCLAIRHTTLPPRSSDLPIAVEVTRIELIPIAQAPCPRPTLAPS